MTYINKFNPEAGFDTEERCYINELLNTPVQAECSIAQKIANTGTEELVFLCICTPRFELKNYLKLE